jgi:hypothetical protein
MRADSVTLGPITLGDHPFMTTDLTFLAPFLGREIAGVIGYGVLSRCGPATGQDRPAP